MIVCASCLTHNADGSTSCSGCGADLTGDGGISIASPALDDGEELPTLDLDLDLGARDASSAVPPIPTLDLEPEPSAQDVEGPSPQNDKTGSRPAPPIPHVAQPTATGPAAPSGGDGADLVAPPPGQGAPAVSPQQRGVLPSAARAADTSPPFVAVPPRVATGDDGSVPNPRPAPEVRSDSTPDRPRQRAVSPDEVSDEPGPDAANVQGIGGSPPPSRPVSWAVKRAPRPGELVCGVCQEPNHHERRFCLECGAILPAFRGDPLEAPDLQPPPDNWWRKLTGTTAHGGVDKRTQAQIERDLGQAGSEYSAARTLQTRLAVAAVAVAVVAGLVAVMANRERIFGRDGEAAPLAGLDPTGSADDLPTHSRDGAFDGVDSTAYGLRFTRDGEPDADGIVAVADGSSFTVNLGAPTRVRAVVLNTGFANDQLDLDPALFARVRSVTLVDLGPEPLVAPLRNVAGRQWIDVPPSAEPVDSFVVQLEAVHDPGWDTYDVAAFVEVEVIPADG
ncbi:MAG: hypothetical protein AAF467_08435 [Actinomycetota bacterium]